MTDPKQLPNKTERLSLITDWVDNFVVDATKIVPGSGIQKVDTLIPARHMALLDIIPATDSDIKDIGFLGTVVFKRAQYLQMPLTVAALLALTYISERPGDAVMYVTVVKHLFAASQIEGVPAMVTYKMVRDILPEPPNRLFLDKHWDAQKWHGVNLVDLMGPNDFLLTTAEAEELSAAQGVI